MLPSIGELRIREVRPRHIRDMIRAARERTSQRTGRALAPRTIGAIFQLAHNLFETAVVDELIEVNPVRVKGGELPPLIDVDLEWRTQATFSTAEVVRLVSDPQIHPRRRVLYALKGIAGLRHGEAAALAWRHFDETAQPLARLSVVQSWSSRQGLKSTKTGVGRAVPVHPVLLRILLAWRDRWPGLYGRLPAGEDLILPTAKGTPMDKTTAQRAMKRDLRDLGLRVRAGALRSRCGHDLRSWFLTQATEDGADSNIVRRTTHCSPRDVVSGYQRFGWQVLCREISKLSIDVPVADPLAWSGKIRRPRRSRITP